jgi:hypothetical protein
MSITITIQEAFISQGEYDYPKIFDAKDGKQFLKFKISAKFPQRDENTETGWGEPKYIKFNCSIWEGYLIEKFMKHFESGMDLITISGVNLSNFDIEKVEKMGKTKEYFAECYSNFALNGIKKFTMSKRLSKNGRETSLPNEERIDDDIPF